MCGKMVKVSKKDGKTLLVIIIIGALLLIGSQFLSFSSQNCPSFPSNITASFISTSTATYPTGYVLASCENNFGTGTSLSSVVYQISYQEWLGAPVGYRYSTQVNATIATEPNATVIDQANANMSSQVSALNATILYDGEQAAQNDCGGCSIYSAEAWSGTEYVNTEVQQLLLKSIAYNNALLATAKPVTTTVNVTTINATTTIMPPQPPQFNLSQSINQIISFITNFLNSIGL